MREIKTTQGATITVDDDAPAWVFTRGWYLLAGKYPATTLGQKEAEALGVPRGNLYLARVIAGAKEREYVRYQDKNRLNCTRQNLFIQPWGQYSP